jgi:hypothetical protein
LVRNIFLRNEIIRIGDFGISRILMGTMDMATTFTGTPVNKREREREREINFYSF